MDTSEQILVIFLSTALAIFLTLAIVIAVMVIKLLQQVRRLSDKAEHIVENVEHVGETFRNASGPLALFKVISNIVDNVSRHNQRK